MRPRPVIALLLLLLPTLGATTTRPAELDPAALKLLYRQSLGPRYNESDFPKLLQAHRLLETYFASPPTRESTLTQLRALNLPLDTIARLCPLHLNWPTLKPGVYYVNEPHEKSRVRYFLGLPANYSPTRAYPLTLLLPQADAFLEIPLPDGDTVAKTYTAWMNDELAHHPDVIVLMPLLNLDEFFGPSQPGMDSVIQPLLHVPSLAHIDPARVYLIGHGMSAHAVWNLGLHYTTYFAALNVLAGSATQDNQRLRMINLRNTLPVIWHDADDPILPVRVPRSIVAQLRKMNLDVAYNETKDVGHVPPVPVADANYTQTLARTRDLYPERISLRSNRPGRIFNRLDWLEIEEPSHPGDDVRLLFHHGSGDLVLHKNASGADATLDAPNHVTLTTENVATLRLYFTGDMVDTSKPLTLTINGRAHAPIPLQPSLETLLADQLFLGRGWRAFTTVLEIEPVPRPAAR